MNCAKSEGRLVCTTAATRSRGSEGDARREWSSHEPDVLGSCCAVLQSPSWGHAAARGCGCGSGCAWSGRVVGTRRRIGGHTSSHRCRIDRGPMGCRAHAAAHTLRTVHVHVQVRRGRPARWAPLKRVLQLRALRNSPECVPPRARRPVFPSPSAIRGLDGRRLMQNSGV